MILTHEKIKYASGGNITKVGGVSKTNRIIRNAQQLKSIEEQMMNFAYKIGRSENQREERRNKR